MERAESTATSAATAGIIDIVDEGPRLDEQKTQILLN
jgi:hypothetical protein